MIVNPQLFNYRLIIGSLVIAIVVLGTFSFSSYNTLKTQQEFIEQESKLVQNELSEMISRYDDVSVENEAINIKLRASKSKTEAVLYSLRQLKTTVSLITKYKAQLRSLQLERNNLFDLVNKFEEENQNLKDQSKRISEKLESQDVYLKTLESRNNKLSETLKKVEQLKALNVKVKAVTTASAQSVVETTKAKLVDHLEVCFTLSKNEFTPKGNKDLFIQIIDPNGNVVSNKGLVHFGESSLIYSGKTKVYYLNDLVNVCIKINIDDKEMPAKGTYFASVYHKDQRLGGSEIKLN
jgi:hypothetical protein